MCLMGAVRMVKYFYCISILCLCSIFFFDKWEHCVPFSFRKILHDISSTVSVWLCVTGNSHNATCHLGLIFKYILECYTYYILGWIVTCTSLSYFLPYFTSYHILGSLNCNWLMPEYFFVCLEILKERFPDKHGSIPV